MFWVMWLQATDLLEMLPRSAGRIIATIAPEGETQ